MEKINDVRPIILIFGVLTFFIFFISFAIFYTTENFSTHCGCKLPLWVIIVSISSLGLFVGLITFYLISSYFIKEKKEIEKNMDKLLQILEDDDRRVIELLIKNKGEINQSYLSKYFGFDKVKISRIISKMENKKIITKEKNGMTNKLKLNECLLELFLKK